MLHEFLSANRDDLIDRCRLKVVQRRAPKATDAEIEHGIPHFLLFRDRRAGQRGQIGPRPGPADLPASVEAIGGVLSVRNRPGVGCVFTVDLPRHTAAAV